LRGYIMQKNALILIFVTAAFLGIILIITPTGKNQNNFQNIPIKDKTRFNQSQVSGLKWK